MKGLRHGKGKVEWDNGTTYEGEFNMGNIEGEGTMIREDGKKY